jgi:3-methyladenine DNA glycosylase/8-oxoguanine DNA glycosylase
MPRCGCCPPWIFGALVFQIIGQQISVIAATAIFARLIERFGARAPANSWPLTKGHCIVSDCLGARPLPS